MRLSDKIECVLNRRAFVVGKDKTRKTTEDIVNHKDSVYAEYLELDKSGKNTSKHKAWMDALDWVLGNGYWLMDIGELGIGNYLGNDSSQHLRALYPIPNTHYPIPKLTIS